MTGEPPDRKASTSSGPFPPTHTVAEKLSQSCVPVLLPVLNVDMPQAGRATRSGSTDFGGFVRYGTAGSAGSVPARGFAGPGGPAGGTTVILTLAVALRAATWKRPA